jgi:exodeoxyribonuclease-5
MYDLEDEETMTWRRRPKLEADLIIVDEASMVGWRTRKDLESYGIPIIYIGDPFQLPPVGDDESSVMDNLDFLLTEIRRQAEGSPIIKIATAIREGRRYDDVDQCSLRDKDLLDFETIICLSNAKRHQLNQRKRLALGLEGPAKIGDRVMIATTDYDHGLFAGECGVITNTNYKRRYTVHFDGWPAPCNLFNVHFMQPNDNAYSQDLRGRQCLDFGYVITCHKSQGSQYDSVLVWEERRADARWKYTAATRAVNKLLMAG